MKHQFGSVKEMLEFFRATGAQGGKTAARRMTKAERIARAKKAAAASAKVRTQRAQNRVRDLHPKTTIQMQLDAMSHAAGQSCVGIVGRGGVVLGTGTFIKDRYRQPAILTAEHVIRGTPPNELRFFLPRAGARIAEYPITSPAQIPTNEMRERVSLNIQKLYQNRVLDVALLVLSNDVVPDPFWTFRNINAPSRVLPIGSPLLLLGYPADRALTLSDGRKIAMSQIVYPTVVKTFKHRSVNPATHRLLDFPYSDEIKPHGFSGGAIWYHVKDKRKIWKAEPGFAGMIIEFISSRNVLIALKPAAIRKFLRHVQP